ncbi:MAG: NusG domain II-containing protein [Bacteroidales bacterium]|nr:NusG domain II-containing protein [Bacteroidales bacterium]
MNEPVNNKTEQKPAGPRYTRDLMIVAVLLLAALALFFLMRSRQERDTGIGAQAVVTVDGREIGRYPLRKSGTFSLNGGTNILVVENGEAWVSEADCPDKVCMGMGKISRNGEFIACLPNRLLVVVEGAAEQSPVDGMT